MRGVRGDGDAGVAGSLARVNAADSSSTQSGGAVGVNAGTLTLGVVGSGVTLVDVRGPDVVATLPASGGDVEAGPTPAPTVSDTLCVDGVSPAATRQKRCEKASAKYLRVGGRAGGRAAGAGGGPASAAVPKRWRGGGMRERKEACRVTILRSSHHSGRTG